MTKRSCGATFIKRSGSLTREDARDLAGKSRIMKQAVKELDKTSRDAELRLIEDFKEKAVSDKQAELDYALHEGLQKGRQELILNMLKEKADVQFIAKVTGLSVKEIKNFKKRS